MGSQERRDPTFQIKDSIFEGLSSSSRTARNPPSNISNASAGRGVFVFCLWSLRYLRETLETPRRVHQANVFHLALSLPVPSSHSCFCLGPFFYEKARISLMGSSKRRRSRNSRWATSIFLLKINGHADTRKKKKLLHSILSFLRSYRTSISLKQSSMSRAVFLFSFVPLSAASILSLHIYCIRKPRTGKL